MNMQEMIEQLPIDLGAEIVECTGTEWWVVNPSFKAKIKFKNWPVIMAFGQERTLIPFGNLGTGGTTAYTSIYAGFVPVDNFEFKISYKKFLSMFKKHLPIGYPELAGRNVLAETNDEIKLGTILQNSKIHELLVKIFNHAPGSFLNPIEESISITEEDNNISVLKYTKINSNVVAKWNENIDLFKNVYELLKETLVQLAKIGSISEEEPKY